MKKWKAGDEGGEVTLSSQFVSADCRMNALHAKAIAETLAEFDGMCQCGCASPWDMCTTQKDPEKRKAPRWHIKQVAFFGAQAAPSTLLCTAGQPLQLRRTALP